MLPKHLDEKVARLHLDALGVQADRADARAGRLHRRARRGPVQARPLPLLGRYASRADARPVAAAPCPRHRRRGRSPMRARPGSSGRTGRCPCCARSASASPRERPLDGLAVGRLPARHRGDGEPRARAGRRRRRGGAVRGQPALHAGRRRGRAGRADGVRGPRAPRRGRRRVRRARRRARRGASRRSRSTTAPTCSALLHAARPDAAERMLGGDRGDDHRACCACARWRPRGGSRCPVIAVNEARTERVFNDRYGTGPVDARRHPARDQPAARRPDGRRARLRLDRARASRCARAAPARR